MATTAAGSRRTGSARRWWPPGCPTSGRCRTTCRSTTRWARRAVSTPSRGTSSSRSRPDASSARGSTCAPVPRSAPRSPPSSIRRERCSCLAASVTRFRRWNRTPPTSTSSTITARPTRPYTGRNLADETVAINWPIPLERARTLGEGPRPPAPGGCHPHSASQDPRARRRRTARPRAPRRDIRRSRNARRVRRARRASTSPPRNLRRARRWRDYDTIINAAAYTAVDVAETP